VHVQQRGHPRRHRRVRRDRPIEGRLHERPIGRRGNLGILLHPGPPLLDDDAALRCDDAQREVHVAGAGARDGNRRLVRADDAAIDQIGGEPGVIGWVDAERRRQRLEYNSGRMPTVALALAILALQSGFDHGFAAYRDLLSRVVRGSRVDYRQLAADRAPLDRIVADLAPVAPAQQPGSPRAAGLAFWINADNILTLPSIVDHYPI